MALSKTSQNLFIFLITLAVSLAASEIYLRWNPPVTVYMEVRNIVQRTHSEVSPHPIIGYIPKANLKKEFKNREFRTTIETNSRNMRDREYPLEKIPGKKRIAVFGDSFVFGWGVENDETFSEILENQKLKDTEVLNFGVSGYGAHQELERLKREGLLFSPDVVLFFLYGFPEGYPEDEGDKFLMASDGSLYRVRPDPPDAGFRGKIAGVLRHSYLYRLLREGIGILLEAMSSKTEEPVVFDQPESRAGGLKILEELKALGQEHRFTPVVVWIPTKEVFKNNGDPESVPAAEYCEKNELLFLNLVPSLIEYRKLTGRSPYFRIDDHWNKYGHRVTAEVLKNFLTEKGLADAK